LFPVERLGPIHCPDDIEEGIPAKIWKRIQQAEAETDSGSIPSEIQDLVDERKIARAAGDWVQSDTLRQRIQDLGWQVRDTSEGQALSRR
jgi:cysteinyl-tRNA synthetase